MTFNTQINSTHKAYRTHNLDLLIGVLY